MCSTMRDFFGSLSYWQIATLILAYFASLAFYRLFLHPLSGIPGPKLAAVTRYYEGYYDLYLNGQYTFKIAELHKEYGPIVRISPYEVHISDATFFDTLYRQDARYDKYSWSMDAFAAEGATVFTAEHDKHKMRRASLNPFFSKARIANQQDMIRLHLGELLQRLDAYCNTDAVFDFGAAVTAFIRDVTNDFMFGKSYESLGREDFDVAMVRAGQGSGAIWRVAKFVRIISPIMVVMPASWVMKIVSGDVKIFFRHIIETSYHTKTLMAASADPAREKKQHTLVDQIMESKLPPSEKAFDRLFNDVTTATGGGFETTASVLRLIFFHLFTDKKMLLRLRSELSAAGASPETPLELKALEQLPYLNALLHEGIRLSPGIGTRMGRISPHSDIAYKQHLLPAGTVVSMSIILMHTDEDNYTNAKQYDPDRWIVDGAFRKIEKAFAPFSKGTRICIGMHLAWAEMFILVADLAQRYDFRFPDATAQDFECESDQFAIGTRGGGVVNAVITRH